MPLLRKIIFYLFIAIYLTVCPALILRLLGFVYNPHTHQFVKTGIIYVSTNPPDAQVYINNVKTNENTPCVIRDLAPNDYTIRMELKDYKIWQNSIPVVARKATILENVLLTPHQWITKPLSSFRFENILPLGDGNMLLAWHEKSIRDLYLLKLNKSFFDENNSLADISHVSTVFPEESIYSDGKIIRVFSLEKSPFFILHILIADKDKYLWIDVRDKQIHIEDISDLLPQEPANLIWEANEDRNIFAFYADHVNRIDIKAKAIYPDILPKSVPTPQDAPPNTSMISGSLYDPDNKIWLEFTPNNIGFWDKERNALQWIYESGKNIRQAFWANNSNTLLFLDTNQVYLLDKEPFGQSRLQQITTIHPNSSIHYSEKTGKLYFIEPHNQLLSTIVILRHKPMIPKPISDTIRLQEAEP